MGKLSQSYQTLLAMWDHLLLSTTRHRSTLLALTLAGQAGARFTYHKGMEG